jgi:5-hydroxyisourate hydrolase-like protein (transthyretin family)
MGRLTTHVLDTASGKPAAALKIELFLLDGGIVPLKTIVTNADGRADGPILEGAAFMRGHYELRFHAGDPDSLRHRRSRRPLSRAAAAFALRLFHLSGKLSDASPRPPSLSPTWPCYRPRGRSADAHRA